MNFLQKSYFNRFVKKLANLQLAIFLLFFIGFVIALGTIIEQDQSLTFYKESYPETRPLLGIISWPLILTLGLNQIYSNLWFIFLIIAFTSSLLACTFTTQIPSLKKFRLWTFLTNRSQFNRFKIFDYIPRRLANIVFYRLHVGKYHLFRQGKKNYGYVGLLGRLGPIAVHFSIILLIGGTAWSAMSGYNIQEIIPRGELFHFQNIVKYGPLSSVATHLAVRVNDFWITYTPEAKINQFYSDLSLLTSNGFELCRKVIFVNEPLQYKGLTIYQTDWDLIGLKIRFNDSNLIQIPLKSITKMGQKFWLGSVSVNNEQNQNLTFLVNALNDYIYVYNADGSFLQKVLLGNSFPLDAYNNFMVTDLITSTGLQIKQDPGIFAVYVAFLFIMVSGYISFFSYAQIWSVEQNLNLFIAGKANRAVLSFQEKFRKTLP